MTEFRLRLILPLIAIALMSATSPTDRPILIAHRGASGIVPEHTLAAYARAIEDGADYIEPDLVMSKDGVPIIRHENEISGTTDVAGRPEFADRKRTKTIDGAAVTGWFAEDFTLAELKTLRARERLPQLRRESAKRDGLYPIATLAEAVALVRAEEKTRGRRIGLYPETKHPGYFDSIGLPFDGPMLKALRAGGYTRRSDPVFIQSFETANLKRLRGKTKLRLVQLIDAQGSPADAPGLTYNRMATPEGFRAIARYADGVGLNKNLILPRDAAQDWLAPTQAAADAKAAGLLVHVWTFRAENVFLPASLRKGADPASHGDLAGEIARFRALGIDGLFSDHVAEAAAALR